MPTAKHKVMLGDILPPLNSIIMDLGEPVNLAAYTVKFRLLTNANVVVLNDVTSGVTAHPTQTFTASTTTELLACDGHGVKTGDQIIVASSGTLPTGLSASLRYFAVQVTPNNFGLATTPNGAVIDITGAGSGTHTFYIVGSVQFDFGATEVDEAGTFKGFWRLYSSTEISTFPKGQGEYIPIEVVALGT